MIRNTSIFAIVALLVGVSSLVFTAVSACDCDWYCSNGEAAEETEAESELEWRSCKYCLCNSRDLE